MQVRSTARVAGVPELLFRPEQLTDAAPDHMLLRPSLCVAARCPHHRHDPRPHGLGAPPTPRHLPKPAPRVCVAFVGRAPFSRFQGALDCAKRSEPLYSCPSSPCNVVQEAALTIATMPTRMASGSSGQDDITAAKSGSDPLHPGTTGSPAPTCFGVGLVQLVVQRGSTLSVSACGSTTCASSAAVL